jgi:hypothetical protein
MGGCSSDWEAPIDDGRSGRVGMAGFPGLVPADGSSPGLGITGRAGGSVLTTLKTYKALKVAGNQSLIQVLSDMLRTERRRFTEIIIRTTHPGIFNGAIRAYISCISQYLIISKTATPVHPSPKWQYEERVRRRY